MKLKITCRPRYNPWLKSISRLLTFGILLNNIPINSFASVLSEDTRYETFEDDNIIIPNILEENKVDVEIEGDTLVNKLGWVTKKNNSSTIIDGTKKTISFNKPVTEFNYHVTFENATVEVDKTYTLVFNILKNTLVNTSGSSSLGRFNILSYNKGNYHINAGETGLIKVTLTQPSTSTNIKPFLEIYRECEGEFIIQEPYLLEGDWTNKELPDYFEGIKSVGEQNNGAHSIELVLENKNVLKWEENNIRAEVIDFINNNVSFSINNDMSITFNGVSTQDTTDLYLLGNWKSKKTVLHLNPGMYKLSIGDDVPSGYFEFYLINETDVIGFSRGISSLNITQPTDITGVMIRCVKDASYTDFTIYPQIELSSTKTTYSPYQSNANKILLPEPLRGLPNGIKDRVIKKNGRWLIERNVEQIVLDGDEDWFIDIDRSNSLTNYFRTFDFREGKDFDGEYNYKTDFYLNDKYIQNTASNNWSLVNSEKSNLDVNRSKAVSIREEKLTLEEFKNKLKNNPVTVVCQLINPYYESLNIDSVISLYKDTTYISNDSIIPANMKVVVDRTLNRAVEYTELAKANPTINNLSKARYWNNLLEDSIKKDQLQEEVNNITTLNDMVLDKKTATSNLDLYIKCENLLQMSLFTNSITFDDFSGVEDMVKENAVQISINSSLPYSLNAYLPTEIQNSDKSNTMNKDILNIKENSESAYQTFENTIDKIILKDNNPAGNDLIHNIDIKLKSGIAHQKDVYKTTIRFETQQK